MKFKDGDVVIVSDSAHEYKQRYLGKIGTIESIFRKKDRVYMYGVRFEKLRNPVSSKGLFWFEARSLDHQSNNILTTESEETPMFENFVVAKIQFLDNPVPVYSYALYEDDINPGDVVVVQTGSHGFALAKIYSLDGTPEAKKEVIKGRQVVCKVDFSAYNARQDALRRANELQKQMDAKVREVQTLHIYEMFAEKDESLKAMLDEFKILNNLIKGESSVGEAHEAV